MEISNIHYKNDEKTVNFKIKNIEIPYINGLRRNILSNYHHMHLIMLILL